MALGYTEALRHSQLDEITAAVDSGAGAGLLRIYDGTRPADADTALSGNTLLAELTFSDPSFPAASGGDLTASAITDDSSADATGTATFFRIVNSDASTVVMDGDVGTSGSDLNLNSTSITSGGTVSVSSFVITGGNAQPMKSGDFQIVAEGSVTGPPDLEEVMFRLTEAADAKESVTLSAGEARVLVLYLSQ